MMMRGPSGADAGFRAAAPSKRTSVVPPCVCTQLGGVPQGWPSNLTRPQRQRRDSASGATRRRRTSTQLDAVADAVSRAAGLQVSPRGGQLVVHDWRTTEEPGGKDVSSERSVQRSRRLEPWPVTQRVLDDVVTMFNTMPYEHDYWVDAAWVTGRIPPELRGTYLRNGPALQVASGRHRRHFMDGDGCVLSLAFPGGGAPPRFTNRYVRTKGFVDEQAAGKPVHRNAFTRGAADGSMLFNPLDLNFKNVANTNVLCWGGRMWALWEVGLPYELNPRTLETLGESDLDGQIRQRLAGHYRVITEPDGSQRLVVFGAQVSFSGMHLEFYELGPDGRVLASSTQPLKGFDINFIHDMLVTEHWYIVIMGPVSLDVKGFLTDYLLSKRSLAELLQYNKDHPSKVFLYPRPGKAPPAAAGPLRRHELLAPPFFSFHHVNAYEQAGGAEVVVDTISWQDIAFDVTQYNIKEDYYDGGCRSQLYRLVAHLPTSRVRSCRRMVRRTLEFPTYAMARATGKPYRFAYFSADAVDHDVAWAPAQAVLKVQLPIEDEARAAARQQQPGGHRPGHLRPEDALTAPVWAAAPPCATSAATPTPRASPAGGAAPRPPQAAAGAAMNHIVPLARSAAAFASAPGSASQRRDQQQQEGGGEEEGVVCEEWRPGPRCFPQEPMFVPRRGATAEDDGWIIVGVHNAETMRGEVAILDAQRLGEGPVAVIHLPHALPTGLHGTWTDEYLGPDPGDATVPAWRTPHRIREL